MMRSAILTDVALPDFAEPLDEPAFDESLYGARADRFRQALRLAGLDAAVIYGDREHSGNIAWLSGFDPRFEEALLVFPANGQPVLLTGPENQGPGKIAPLAMEVLLHQPFGLMGQSRKLARPIAEVLLAAGLQRGRTIGVAGWKYQTAEETGAPATTLEIPSYLADALRDIAGDRNRIVNIGALFMNPDTGFRAINEVDELARFEFAACHTSSAVKRVVLGTRPGMREFEAVRFLQPIGMPLSCHMMMTGGPRAWHGLLSPSSRKLQRGDAVTTGYGVWRALNCRAGFLAEGPDDLPAEVRDYVEKLVAPYFEAIAEWLETVAIGLPGRALDEVIRRRLGDPFFGVGLNPGHLIHLDEWMHSPIRPGNDTPLCSGMALQIDVIPATGTPYFTTNIEDGIALLDQNGRAEFAERHPAAWQRIEARRAFLSDVIGIHPKPDVLPLSNIAGWLPPFWLSPRQAMAMRG